MELSAITSQLKRFGVRPLYVVVAVYGATRPQRGRLDLVRGQAMVDADAARSPGAVRCCVYCENDWKRESRLAGR